MFVRFVQFKILSENDIKNLQKTVLKNDVKMMKKNIKKWTKNGGKIRKNDLQKSMSKIDAEKCGKEGDGVTPQTPRNTYNSTRLLRKEPT